MAAAKDDKGVHRRALSTSDLFELDDIWSFETRLDAGRSHSVLFHLPLPRDHSQPPQPQRGSLMWNGDHVRMPYANESQFTEIDEMENQVKKSRWNLIEETLLQPIQNSLDLEKAIKTYNSRYDQIWGFQALHLLFDNFLPPEETKAFFDKLLPAIIRIALQLPHLIQSPIPLLKKKMNHSISMSQQQVASLLANAFLCTFPMRNTDKKNSEYASYPTINFSSLFAATSGSTIEKLKCILNYFRRVTSQHPTNIMTFQRRSIDSKVSWESSDISLSTTKFFVTDVERIEDAEGMLQVDFANRFVGGGVLGKGCVQEEIRFVINPEMIVARLFTQYLDHDEALVMIGCEQFNCYQGYASTFEWAGNFTDGTPLDRNRRRKCRVVAIDALYYDTSESQFTAAKIKRELNKAYVGFYKEIGTDRSPVASGLWGCGAFKGHPIRSALIQLSACAATKRNLAFYTFGDSEAQEQIIDLFEFLMKENVTVGEIFNILKTFQPVDLSQLVPFIKNEVSSLARTKSAGFGKIKLKPLPKKEATLFNFKNPAVSLMEVDNNRPSPVELSENLPTSSQTRQVSPAVLRDKQKFEEIANGFAICEKPVNAKSVKKVPPKRASLLECLDIDMEANSHKTISK